MNHSPQLDVSKLSQNPGHIAWTGSEDPQEGIAITNEEGVISYLNHAAENILDITFGNALGKPLNKVATLTPLSPLDAKAGQARNDEFVPETLSGLFRLRGRNRNSIVSVQISDMASIQRGGRELVFIIREIPDHSELIKTLRGVVARNEIVCPGPQQTSEDSLPPKERAPGRVSLTYLCLHGISSPSLKTEPPDVLENLIGEAYKLLRNLTHVRGSMYQINSGESVLLIEESSQNSTIEFALKLIDVIRAKFQLTGHPRVRIGLSVGVLILSPSSSKPNASLMVEAARQLCVEARQLGNNALQVYDMNSHETGNPTILKATAE
jgi:hypothetical protein